ncbi:MAG: hypothetical protein JNM77_09940 [Pseudonocardia sp.]|nr:hypothetical protein [Pseudonocardia sp.]
MSVVQPSQQPDPSRAGPLPRRSTDRVEDAAAWLLTAAALFLMLGAVFVGVGLHADTVDRGRSAAQDRTPVAAVLVDAPVPFVPAGWVTTRSARYVDAVGGEQDISVQVAGWPPAGVTVQAWLDRDGRVVDAPSTPADAVVVGTSAGVGTAIVGLVVLGVAWLGLRRWLDHRNAVGWAREWYRVELEWSGRNR